MEATEFKDLFGEQAKEERELLLYQTYKLFIYYEEISNLRVEEALIEYITNDNGLHFYLKCISYLKLHPKAILQPIRKEILCVKEYAKEEHIVLKDEM